MYRFTYIHKKKKFVDVLCRGMPDISAPDEPPKAPPQDPGGTTPQANNLGTFVIVYITYTCIH